MGTKYPFTVEKFEDGKLFVQLVDFPNGITEGDDLVDARKNAQDVLELLVSVYKDEGRALPKPSPVIDIDLFVALK